MRLAGLRRKAWALCLALAVVAGPVAAQSGGLALGADLGHEALVDQMEFVKSDATEPPATGWQPQPLPDSWRTSRPGQSGYGWYRARLVLERQPSQTVGLLIAMVGTTSAVYVNGVEIGSSGAMQGEIQRGGGQPQLLAIAPQSFAPGENWLHVRLRVAPNLRGGITALRIGPRVALEDAFLGQYFWRVTLPRSANVALVIIGLLVGLLWLRRPAAAVHGYFAALAVIWSLRNFHYTYNGSAIPSRLWEAFVLGSLGWVLVLLWLFMLRLTGQASPRAERPVTWVFALMPLVFLALGEQAMSGLRLPWYTACIALGLASIVVLVRHLRAAGGPRRPGPWLVLGALLLTLGFGLHDYAFSAGWLPYGTAPLMAFGAPLLLASLVFTLAGEYFSALDAVQKMNVTLERRIDERTRELADTYAQMSELQGIAAVAQERERLMRDIHDGVGSQLIAARQGIEAGAMDAAQASDMLTQCIDDLRLVIDSLDPEQRNVADALATLRHRLQPRLSAAGLQSRWKISQTPVCLQPNATLDLMRMVQEALSNVLKHARATEVDVRFEAQSGEVWELSIEDNGVGLVAPGLADAQVDTRPMGRGLGNLQRRATKLGARLAIDSVIGGPAQTGHTRVSVTHGLAQPR